MINYFSDTSWGIFQIGIHMIKGIKTIILGKYSGNCYLLETDKGYVLIDSGSKSKRNKLKQELYQSNCKPENINLIILTHGDFDHTGNCAYFQEKHNVKIAIHQYDSGMVINGDMFWNRKVGNWIIRKIVNIFFRITKFKPDLIIDENSDLSKYGLDAEVIYLPGHSKGSIGILTKSGEFICGDLFTNVKKPEQNSMVDNKNELNNSINKLKNLKIETVFPGHGRPFQMSSLKNSDNK